MKKVVLMFILSLLLFGFVSSIENELPNPGILPDSFFYGMKRAFEGIGNFFTFREEAKFQRALKLSEKRLAEVEAIAEKQKPEYINKISEDYSKNIEKAKEIASKTRENKREELTERLAQATSRHIEILDEVYDRVPEQARERIRSAQEKSIKGNQEALKAIARENPEKSAEIAMQVAEARLNRANREAKNNRENEAIKAIEEYERYSEFGNEISEIARQIRGDSAIVNELIARATSRHIEILDEVYERAPEQARERISIIINSSLSEKVRGKSGIEELVPIESPPIRRIGQEIIEGPYACNNDEDCIAVQDGPCDCNHMGKNTAINKDYEDYWYQRMRILQEIGCLTAISDHWTCFAKPRCIDNRCQLIE